MCLGVCAVGFQFRGQREDLQETVVQDSLIIVASFPRVLQFKFHCLTHNLHGHLLTQ